MITSDSDYTDELFESSDESSLSDVEEWNTIDIMTEQDWVDIYEDLADE